MSDNTRDYCHPELNREITAIGGHYVIVREERLDCLGGEVLYVVGHGILDRTCCGFGAVCYATVAGFIDQWKYSRDDQGREVSRVSPVTRARDQEVITRQIKQKETMISQVNFLPPGS